MYTVENLVEEVADKKKASISKDFRIWQIPIIMIMGFCSWFMLYGIVNACLRRCTVFASDFTSEIACILCLVATVMLSASYVIGKYHIVRIRHQIVFLI